MDAALRAGIAIYNQEEYHAAHDAWEDHWLSLESGTEDERLLHGLIQFTAAVYHATNRNWAGATGLAESAQEYLAPLPEDYRTVNLHTVMTALERISRDPELIERTTPPVLTYGGHPVTAADLDFEETVIFATVVAEEHGYDRQPVNRAIEYATEAVEADESNPFVGLVFDFVREPNHRDIIMARLSEHVARREHEESDVMGLFE